MGSVELTLCAWERGGEEGGEERGRREKWKEEGNKEGKAKYTSTLLSLISHLASLLSPVMVWTTLRTRLGGLISSFRTLDSVARG